MLKKITLLFLLLSSLVMNAQDPSFSQYHSAPLYLNPAFAGSNGGIRAAAGHRMQWRGLDNRDTVFFKGYNTSVVSYDQYFHKLRSGFGLMYMRNATPYKIFTTQRIEFDYAAHLKIDIDSVRQVVIRPGLSFAYAKKDIDWKKLSFGDMIDPNSGYVFTTSEQQAAASSRYYADMGAGLLVYSKRITGGVAVHHITEPDESFYGSGKLPMKYVLHLSGNIGKLEDRKNYNVSPHLLYVKQLDLWQLLTGAAFRYDKYVLGCAYRMNDAIIMQAGFEIPLFRVSYSYDHTISGLGIETTRGSHELMLSFNPLHKKEKRILPFQTVAL